MIQDPDPRTAPEDGEDATGTPSPSGPATNQGRSAEEPAEGSDDSEPETDGSPRG